MRLILFHVLTCFVGAFVTSPGRRGLTFASTKSTVALLSELGINERCLLAELSSMTARELKAELQALGKPTNDVFEKEQLVKRLYDARLSKAASNTASTNVKNDSRSTSSAQNTQNVASSSRVNNPSTSGILQVPLYLSFIESEMKVGAVNLPAGGGITVTPNDQPYATIQIFVDNGRNGEFTLNLLLDTACSGFVLRPEIVRRYNLPSYTTPVTMTGAGGSAAATGLTQLTKFRVGKEFFGPLPAAVQDIGALPTSFDGIIGLSFINQFACLELDFRNGLITFFRDQPPPRTDFKVVADAEMRMLPRLGIYAAKVFIGGRGPVEMLIDTGAASSFLSWKGVSDLGLDSNSKFIQPLRIRMGAMGSDNIAMELSHRINVSSKLELGAKDSYPGISLAGRSRLTIDIGKIPLLETLQQDGVGGILGIDALMRCAAVRFSTKNFLKVTVMND